MKLARFLAGFAASLVFASAAAAGPLPYLNSIFDTANAASNAVITVSQIFCQTNGYAGTGIPIAVNVVPGAGSFTYAIQNVATAAALNATVVTACIVYN